MKKIDNGKYEVQAAIVHHLSLIHIFLGFYDDIQNDRITPHLTGWGGSPAGEPETR